MNDLQSLDDLFNKKIFRIPDYQRGYSWGNQQLEEFWEDILNMRADEEHYTGMISLKELDKEYTKNWNDEQWLINNGYKVFHVVDGQQRLTTFIILINEIKIYYSKINPTEKPEDIIINDIRLSDIVSKYLVMQKPKSEEVVRTYRFGYETDNPSYEFFKNRILESRLGGSTTETFYTLNLENAKLFFASKIEHLVEEKGLAGLESVFRKITQNMKFNMYYLENDFNVFVAFETMNNRGKKLSYLELLKNRLIYLSTLFKVDRDEQLALRNEINDTWKTIYEYLGKNKNRPLNDDEFLRNHWMIYFGYTRSNKVTFDSFLLRDYFTQKNILESYSPVVPEIEQLEIPANFDVDEDDETDETEIDDTPAELSDIIDNRKVQLTTGAIHKYINSLRELVPYWYNLHFPENIEDDNIKEDIEKLKRVNFSNFKPLATVVLSRSDLTNEQKHKALQLMERYTFLYFRLNNYQGTFSNSFYFNLAHNYYINKEGVNFDGICCNLNHIDFLDKNNTIVANGIHDRFNKYFRNAEGFYSWPSLRYFLYEYEISIRTSESKLRPEELFTKDKRDHISVEHIYPQTPKDEYWVREFGIFDNNQKKCLSGSLGNLLPLSMEINSSLQNDKFSDKKNGTEKRQRGYINGSFSEQEVAKNDNWTAKEIYNRGMKLCSFMESRWNFRFRSDDDKISFLGLDFLKDVENFQNI